MVGARGMTDVEKHASDAYIHHTHIPGAGVFRLVATGNIFGPSTAGNDSLTGDYNFAVGRAMPVLTTGKRNIAIGDYAGYALTEGDDNILIGASAGGGITTRDDIIFIGSNAGWNATGNIERGVFLGINAGGDVSGGVDNIGIGNSALYNAEVGANYNVAIGNGAGSSISTGAENVYVGAEAGFFATIGDHNVGVGFEAIVSLTTGEDNVSLGYDSLVLLTTGSQSAVVGTESCSSIQTGDGNVAIGYRTGFNVELASARNVFIGYQAGPATNPISISDELYIDNHATDTPLIQGDFSGHTIDINGTLSKTAGAFKIDHPLDESKHLIHGFIEGPEYGLLYRGEVTLIDGKATVNIDEACGMSKGVFEAIAQNPTVYLQNKTGFNSVMGKVENSTIYIRSYPACDNVISWLVCAERKDKFVMECAQTDDKGHLILELERSDNGAPTSSQIIRRHS